MNAESDAENLGRTGWLIVGVVSLAFLVIPGVIYLAPVLLDTFGLSFIATYLVLPLVPAIALGSLAVWLAARAGTRDSGN